MNLGSLILDIKNLGASLGLSKLVGLSAAVALNSSLMVQVELSSPDIEIQLSEDIKKCASSQTCIKSMKESSSKEARAELESSLSFVELSSELELSDELLAYTEQVAPIASRELASLSSTSTSENTSTSSDSSGSTSSEGTSSTGTSGSTSSSTYSSTSTSSGYVTGSSAITTSEGSTPTRSTSSSTTIAVSGANGTTSSLESLSNSTSTLEGAGSETSSSEGTVAGASSTPTRSTDNTDDETEGEGEQSTPTVINMCNSSLDATDTSCVLYSSDEKKILSGGLGEELLADGTGTTNQFSAYIVFKSNKLFQAGDTADADVILDLPAGNGLEILYGGISSYTHTLRFNGNTLLDKKASDKSALLGDGVGITESGLEHEGKFNNTHLIHISWAKKGKVGISLDGQLLDVKDASSANLNLNGLHLGHGLDGEISEIILVNKATIDDNGALDAMTVENLEALKTKWAIP